MSLKSKTFSGIIWTFIDLVVVRTFSFVAMLILARWLGPVEFGLVGMIAVFIAIGQTLTVSGMTTSLIRTTNADEKDFSTVFFINLGMSLLVYMIIYLVAPYIAQFFNQDILIDVIRVYCLIFLLTAFSAVHLAILNKKMAFRKITILSTPSTIIGILVGLFLGYNGYGVWSIVWLYLSTEISRTILLWIFSSWNPRLIFSINKFKLHYGFGYKLMLSSLLDTVFQNIYNILIGKYYTAQTLGYFERAKRFSEYPSASLTGIIAKVSYPMLSSLQDDPKRLENVYQRLLKISFFFIAPLMLGAAAIAKPMFLIVLGGEWLPAVIFFQILCLAMMLYPIHAFNLNILNVYGRSDLFLRLELIKKGITVVAIIIAFQFGIIGLVWSSVFISFAALIVNMYFSSKLINYPVKEQLTDLSITLVIAGSMAIIMYGISVFSNNFSNIIQILLATGFGIVFYFGINYFIKKSPLHQTIWLLKTRNQ